jgi:hypothetical protein
MSHRIVCIVPSGGVPVTLVPDGPPALAVADGPPVTVVSSGAPPICVVNGPGTTSPKEIFSRSGLFIVARDGSEIVGR